MENDNEIVNKVILLEKENNDLKERVQDLEDFIENAALCLHWVNGSGIITWANQFELDVMGYKKEEYVGKHISNFHADKEVIDDILFRLINKETIINYPATLLTKKGKRINVLINSNVHWRDGEFVHTRCFTREIPDMSKIKFTNQG